jgi:hypothetical protein
VVPSQHRAFFGGNVLPDGIHFRERRESWWPASKLPDALAVLKLHVLPWFQWWNSPRFLIEKVELAIQARTTLQGVLEPYSEEERLAGARYSPGRTGLTAIPVFHYYSAAILHYIVGNKEMAVRRTEDLLNRLSPGDQGGRAEALAQLSALKNGT